MFKAIALTLAVALAGSAHSMTKKYNPHFENPITDARIHFGVCAVEGALIGILTGDLGGVLCWGRDTSKMRGEAPRDIYAYKGNGRKTVEYYEMIEERDLGSFGEQEGGYREWSVKLRLLTRELTAVKPARVSTIKFRTEWFYSEGSTVLKGRLPGSKLVFEAPVFHLDTLDQELKDFADEIDHP